MKILTASEMRRVDELTAARAGIGSAQLMETAGIRVLEFLQSRFRDLPRRRIVVLCGKGNNGGDGLVVARLLKRAGATPQVFLLADPATLDGDARENLQRWEELGGEIAVVRETDGWQKLTEALGSAEIVLDALLGTGLRGPATGLLGQGIERLRSVSRDAVVVAVDIPSGITSDSGEVLGPAVHADYTVTFTAPKLGQVLAPASEHVGRLVVADIGSPAELIEECSASTVRWLETHEFAGLPLRRRMASNKGNFGHVLIVAGSLGKAGAAIMAGWSALRTGAGLATAAVPETVIATVAGPLPELMTEPLPATEAGTISLRSQECGRFAAIERGKTVMAIGPGLSTQQETQEFIRAVVAESPLPIILDADGLNAFAGRAGDLRKRRSATLAVTPHPGEMARLLGSSVNAIQGDRLGVARRCAADWNAWVILKGYQTVVAASDGRAWINSTGNPGMATGGTGDVLTGMLAGLTAQWGIEFWQQALTFGVYLHGLAGDLAAAENGEPSLMATDLIRAIPGAMAKVMDDLENWR